MLVAVVALTGCGGGDDGYVSGAALVDTFEERTGEQLIRSSTLTTDTWEVYGLGEGTDADKFDDEDSRLATKLGVFDIYLIRSGRDAEKAIADLLEAAEHEQVLPKDTTGIVWIKTCNPQKPPCFFSATKQYGPNVLLVWQAGEEQKTDATWQRLDAVLVEAAGGKAAPPEPVSEALLLGGYRDAAEYCVHKLGAELDEESPPTEGQKAAAQRFVRDAERAARDAPDLLVDDKSLAEFLLDAAGTLRNGDCDVEGAERVSRAVDVALGD